MRFQYWLTPCLLQGLLYSQLCASHMEMLQKNESFLQTTHAVAFCRNDVPLTTLERPGTGQCAATGFVSGMEQSKKSKSMSTDARIVRA